MNDNTPLPHHDPADADEARVLAVLLGEASPFEAEAVAELLAARPALRAYRDRTATLLGLLPDAAKPEAAGTPELRLDDSRRAALLAKLREPAENVSEETIQFPSSGPSGRGRIIGFFRLVLAGSRGYAALLAILLLLASGLSVMVPMSSTRSSRRAESDTMVTATENFATGAGGDLAEKNYAGEREELKAATVDGEVRPRELNDRMRDDPVLLSVVTSANSVAPAPVARAQAQLKEIEVAQASTEEHRENASDKKSLASASVPAFRFAGLAKAKAQSAGLVAVTVGAAKDASSPDYDAALPGAPKPSSPPVPQTETPTGTNAFSTFSLNVSDVSFRLAAEAVKRGAYPDSGGIRTEEFVNAQVYRDPVPRSGEAVALRQEQARHPFAHNRTLLRLSLRTAAEGREAASPLNLVLLLDSSGSMERSDRRDTVAAAETILADNLRAGDKLSVIGFARDTRLIVDRMDGANTQPLRDLAKNGVPAEGGTNLENALNAAYAQLARQTASGGSGRVLLLTDGAANLGDADPARLAAIVENNRRQGRALDAFGIGFDGYNDTLLEQLSRKGDGRYAYLNNADEARDELGAKLAGALRPFANDVKVQVEFNPARVSSWRLLGYYNHRLEKRDLRNNKVDAAELAASESGTALYALELKSDGAGDIGVVRVRYRVPGTQDYKEREWPVANTVTPAFSDAPEGVRLAGCAAFVAEVLGDNPNAAGIDRVELRKEIARLAAGRPSDPRLAALRLLAEKLP